VFRDSPVLRAISRIESWSRSAQRRITLSNSMSITPVTPAENSRGKVKTWVKSQWKFCPKVGQFSVQLNNASNIRDHRDTGPGEESAIV
jgi:hypothetical protein